MYSNIPDKFIRRFARTHNVPLKRAMSMEELCKKLIEAGHKGALEYLDEQFRFSGDTSALTILRPNSQFPDKSGSAETFIKSLIEETYILPEQVGTDWKPPLRPNIQICGIECDGSDVFIRMVVEKRSSRKVDYEYETKTYASFASAVIHFSDQVIELRCSPTSHGPYARFLMKLLGYPEKNAKWHTVTQITEEQAKAISDLLNAGMASTQIAIPSSVGSLVFNGKSKGIDLRNNPVFNGMKKAIEQELNIPVDDTMDETCCFNFIDPVTKLEIFVAFEINLKKGYLKFVTEDITQAIIEKVLDAFISVVQIQPMQVAASSEK